MRMFIFGEFSAWLHIPKKKFYLGAKAKYLILAKIDPREMSVSHEQRKFYTLQEIAQSIQNALAEKTEVQFWATAEIVKLGYYPQSGHCYPQLVEKKGNKVIAEMRGIIWKYDFFRINNKFKKITGNSLGDGITVYFQCKLKYDALYGLSLHITDIDPIYTIGQMEQDRLSCIKKLTRENIYTLNRQLPTPFLVKKLAVISVQTSKGYQDFLSIIEAYRKKNMILDHDLFPALLQGDKSPPSIIQQLERISGHPEYEAVAILRGGGGDVGLASYNDYELASRIATFALPVFTGIGHSTNETVTELVSHRYFITPTDLATYLMEPYARCRRLTSTAVEVISSASSILISTQLSALAKYKQSISAWAHSLINRESERLLRMQHQVSGEALDTITSAQQSLKRIENQLLLYAERPIHRASQKLTNYRKNIEILDPKNVLERGFTLTYQDGHVLKSIKDLDPDKTLKTLLHDGEIKSQPQQ